MSHPHSPRPRPATPVALALATLAAACLATATPAAAIPAAAAAPAPGPALGTGLSQHAGAVPLTTYWTGTTYQLRDPTRGDTRTLDAMNQSTGSGGVLFTDPDNTWGDGTPAHRQTAAVDVQYGSAVTWDFYLAAFGRKGVRGDGRGVTSRVHVGSAHPGAHWDDSCGCVGYGDGAPGGKAPTSLDIVGHTLAQGLVSSTGNLAYSGEPGALRVATADILAAGGEFFADNPTDVGDYLFGERLQPDAPLRRMDRPSSDGRSPDYWSKDIGRLDPYAASGPARHFFYLLAEGSGTKTINAVTYDSPTHDGSRLPGIGRDKALRIWYRALTLNMTSTTSYAGARTATLRAATDLYGPASPEATAVAATWTAVNVR
ncbi:M4 family metallopeptidase [Streptomyces antimicrobicus]|uniref:M4 family metallopeptidase n=1 Tax=Streptomyces antimicrobicus TaxID=2883108 RepID=A0ABS8B2M8_9ACTN|nr:M4 family metallopeptidase [Streptomyces antimicrobicus]MCB5178870.1 M4 family metallopeptidase [Streptomyces antimicrobicus]